MSLLSPSLEAFWAVVQKGTVLEAAKMVDLTQTGVTQRIRSLEKQLGTTLFTRSRKGMRLTQEGESLLRYVQAARDLEGETLSHIGGKQVSTVKEICIAGSSSLMHSRILSRVSPVMKKNPQLRVRFDITDDDSVIGKLKSGFAQLGTLPANQVGKELDFKLLSPERHYFFGPSSWKKRKLEEIISTETIVDFDPQDITTLDLLKKNRLTQFKKQRHFANSIGGVCDLIAAGVGYSALSEEVARPYVKEGLLTQIQAPHFIERSVALAWYPRAAMPVYFRSLIEALTKKT